jgi:molecular chaperone DnaJ
VAARDPYQVLGVSRTASESEIKRAFYAIAKADHPDVNHSPEAAERFKVASWAYSVVGNKEARAHFDSMGFEKTEAPSRPDPAQDAFEERMRQQREADARWERAERQRKGSRGRARRSAREQQWEEADRPEAERQAKEAEEAAAAVAAAEEARRSVDSIMRELRERHAADLRNAGWESCPACKGTGRNFSGFCFSCHGSGIS